MATKQSRSAPAADEPKAPPQNGNGTDVAASRGTPPVWKKRFYSNGSFVECAVFRHTPEPVPSTYPTFSVALDRSYKDGDGQWQETTSLRRDDLLVAGHALQRAYAWITEQEQQLGNTSATAT